MGHIVKHFDFPVKTSKKAIESDLAHFVEMECIREGGQMNPIKWLDVVLPDYPSALEYIEKHDQHRFDCIAVKYKQATKPSKKTLELQEKEVACHREHRNADLLVPAMGFKSDYVGCKNCGSKINRKYIRTNGCPVCGEDMRSPTDLQKIARLKEKLDKATAARIESEKKDAEHGEIRYLVKIEYHQ